MADFVYKFVVFKGLPEHTAFSTLSMISIGPAKKSPRFGELELEKLGELLSEFRSYRSKLNKSSRPKNIPTHDHDLVLEYLNGKPIKNAPLRAAFGLPHNYFFTTSMPGAKAEAGLWDEEQNTQGRRASPLFLHVQGLGDGTYCPVATFLPARFIPEGKKNPGRGHHQERRNCSQGRSGATRFHRGGTVHGIFFE